MTFVFLSESRSRFLSGVIISGFLVACGGGGSNDAVGPATPGSATFPLSTVIANFVNETRSYRLNINGTGISSGQSVSFTGSGVVSESTGSATFEGVVALKKSLTNTGALIILGTSIPIATTVATYFDTSYSPIGSIAPNVYCIASATTPLPTTVRIGDNGSWYTLTCYTSSSKKVVDSTAFVSYSIEPETVTTALLKLITTINGSPTSQTMRINTLGGVTRVSESGFLNVSGVAMNYTATYQ